MSKNMQLIMEEWRVFEGREKLLSNTDYVSNILGVSLPLNEAYPYSPVLTEQILAEQLLLEGWMDSVKNFIATKSKSYKDFFTTWTEIMTDSNKLNSFLTMIGKNMKRELIPKVMGALGLLRSAGLPTLADGFGALVEKFDQMQTSWKKAIVASSLYAVLKYVVETLDKFNIESVVDAIKGKSEDQIKDILAQIPAFSQIKNFLVSKMEGLMGPELLEKAVSMSTDIKTYLGWIGPIVGTVDTVIKSLSPMTGKFQSGSKLTFAQA